MSTYLTKMAEQYIVSQIIGNGFPVSGQTKLVAGLLALSGIFSVLALLMILAAAFVFLWAQYPPHIALSIFGIAVMGLALICAGSALYIQSRRRKAIQQHKEELMVKGSAIAREISGEITPLIKEYPEISMALAAGVGYLGAQEIKK